MSIIDGVQTIFTNIKDDHAKGYILNDDLTTTPCFVAKSNVFFAHGKSLKEAVKNLEEKLFCGLDTDEKISEFWKIFNRTDKYPNILFFEWHNKLTGSCLLGRENFVKNKEIDMDGESTVAEFIQLTKDSYSGEIIKKLEEFYEK